MTDNKRTKAQRERDLADIAELYVKRKLTQKQIADIVSQTRPYQLSRSQISYDLREIRQRWLDSSLVDVDEARAKELAEIDTLEAEAWESYRLSKQVSRTTTQKAGDSREVVGVKETIQETAGNPAFLEMVFKCIKQRCKILGLEEPERFRVEQLQVSLSGDDIRKVRKEADRYAKAVIEGRKARG